MRTLLALAAPLLVGAQPVTYQADATADRAKVRLNGESVTVTLSVEGPAPMRNAVEVPDPLLAGDAHLHWRVRPAGEPEVDALAGGRERWRRAYRLTPLDPLQLGVPVAIGFNPGKANGRAAEWPAVTLTVERTGGPDAPVPDPRPVTGVEDVAPPPVLPEGNSRTRALVSGAVAALCAGLFVLVLRRARRPKPLPPGAWARRELAALEPALADGLELAERVSQVLRRFVERAFGLAAPKLTTAELYEAATASGWPSPLARGLRAVLDECDLAKFAGAAPDAAARAGLVAAAREWLDRADPPPPA